MYRPKNGTPVTWVRMDGSLAAITSFIDTGDVKQWTVEAVIARYGDPRKDPTESINAYRFPIDPIKGSLPAVILSAIKSGNGYGIAEVRDSVLAFQQANDIAATLCSQGEESAIYDEFPPNLAGYSLDRNNPTHYNLPNPPFGLHSVNFAGQKIWMHNDYTPGGGGGQPDQPQAPTTSPQKPDTGNDEEVADLRAKLNTSIAEAGTLRKETASLKAWQVRTQASVRAFKAKLPNRGGGQYVLAAKDLVAEILGE